MAGGSIGAMRTSFSTSSPPRLATSRSQACTMLPTPWMPMVLPFSALARSASGIVVGDPGRLRHVLAQHHLDQRPVDQVGDGEEPLALRGGAQEHRAGAHGEVGAAGQHRVGRADADELRWVTLRPSFL